MHASDPFLRFLECEFYFFAESISLSRTHIWNGFRWNMSITKSLQHFFHFLFKFLSCRCPFLLEKKWENLPIEKKFIWNYVYVKHDYFVFIQNFKSVLVLWHFNLSSLVHEIDCGLDILSKWFQFFFWKMKKLGLNN